MGVINGSVMQVRNNEKRFSSPPYNREKNILTIIASDTKSSIAAINVAVK